MDRAAVAHWIAEYERAWRTPGTDGLARLFAGNARYSPGPYAEPIWGLEAIATMWADRRTGSDEQFTMTSALVALDEHVAVARVEVRYAEGRHWRDLWVMEFDSDGLCDAFEEWPVAAGPDGGT